MKAAASRKLGGAEQIELGGKPKAARRLRRSILSRPTPPLGVLAR